ncbi:MAG: cation diffusion facilitator family transporter, partial [Oscillospiraceae bacterium]
MINIIINLFVKDKDNVNNPIVRENYGKVSSIVGVFVNIFLFISKLFIGILTNSVAVMADAINNLSDAGSSLVSFICFKLSSKPADEKHPFGHERIEYVASLVISF